VILYELLTLKIPFNGKNQYRLGVSVVEEEPMSPHYDCELSNPELEEMRKNLSKFVLELLRKVFYFHPYRLIICGFYFLYFFFLFFSFFFSFIYSPILL
jgi:hypothetical protein